MIATCTMPMTLSSILNHYSTHAITRQYNTRRQETNNENATCVRNTTILGKNSQSHDNPSNQCICGRLEELLIIESVAVMGFPLFARSDNTSSVIMSRSTCFFLDFVFQTNSIDAHFADHRVKRASPPRRSVHVN
jgi:hypothetical protein